MLEDIINTNSEEVLQQYLTNNKEILIAAYGQPAWYYNYVIPKFKLGSEYICDFIVFTGQSYNYWINIVELKTSTTSVFTKKGQYSKSLNEAVKQVKIYNNWIQEKNNYFKECLLENIKLQDSSFYETFEHTRKFIVNSKIVIGRRAKLTQSDNKLRAIDNESTGIDIATYDRLIDIEKKLHG
ncbi:Shedu anti-phage system protein SduA domain-containing protein [Paenibacillus odorifer]|uniref:Shedu anti-phage system protein SduA domain-containing protein n=1 Tax=Paenibacillus odorifer TaxID=189426 RepID=UPI00096F26BD|nr:Shedu anti-phage system protein SduA domain-containing protein [Paenibacillus odorifer]OME10699.1 hypothetical protein BSK60_23615 [Paenibacillus odorifer]